MRYKFLQLTYRNKVSVFLDDIILFLKNPRKQIKKKKTLVNTDRTHKVNAQY